MSLSNCEKCWDTPCSCGWGYKNYSREQLSEFIANATNYRSMDERFGILHDAQELVEKSAIQKPVPEWSSWFIETVPPFNIWKPHNREGYYTSPGSHLVKTGTEILNQVSDGNMKRYSRDVAI